MSSITKHAIVQTDCMSATEERDGIVSVYIDEEKGIDNGCIVLLNELIDSERELYKLEKISADSDHTQFALIATPEVDAFINYGMSHFYNKYRDSARAYRIRNGDIFSVTKEAFYLQDETYEPSVGDQVYVGTGDSDYKMIIVGSGSGDNGNSKVGTMVVGTGVVGSDGTKKKSNVKSAEPTGIKIGYISDESLLSGSKYYVVQIELPDEDIDHQDDGLRIVAPKQTIVISENIEDYDVGDVLTLPAINVDLYGYSVGDTMYVTINGEEITTVVYGSEDYLSIYFRSQDGQTEYYIKNAMEYDMRDPYRFIAVPYTAHGSATAIPGSYTIEIKAEKTFDIVSIADEQTIVMGDNTDIGDPSTYPALNINTDVLSSIMPDYEYKIRVNIDGVSVYGYVDDQRGVISGEYEIGYYSQEGVLTTTHYLYMVSMTDGVAPLGTFLLFIDGFEGPEPQYGSHTVSIEAVVYNDEDADEEDDGLRTIAPLQTIVVTGDEDSENEITWPEVRDMDLYGYTYGDPVYVTINGEENTFTIDGDFGSYWIIGTISAGDGTRSLVKIYIQEILSLDAVSPFRFMVLSKETTPKKSNDGTPLAGSYTLSIKAQKTFDIVSVADEQSVVIDNSATFEDFSTLPTISFNNDELSTITHGSYNGMIRVIIDGVAAYGGYFSEQGAFFGGYVIGHANNIGGWDLDEYTFFINVENSAGAFGLIDANMEEIVVGTHTVSIEIPSYYNNDDSEQGGQAPPGEGDQTLQGIEK